MKTKTNQGKLLAQCPKCMAVKMETNSKKQSLIWQKTFVIFSHLPEEKCYPCSIK